MRVRLTRDAQDELTAIVDYIAERSPSGARNVLAAIDRALEIIGLQPQSAPKTTWPSVRVKHVAKYPYQIFYRIGGDVADVIHIRHAARETWEGPGRAS